MKVPFSWLKEFVDIDVTAQELEEKLFSCGFEVEELIPLDAGISKVVVGKIVEMEKQEGTHLTKCVVTCWRPSCDVRSCELKSLIIVRMVWSMVARMLFPDATAMAW